MTSPLILACSIEEDGEMQILAFYTLIHLRLGCGICRTSNLAAFGIFTRRKSLAVCYSMEVERNPSKEVHDPPRYDTIALPPLFSPSSISPPSSKYSRSRIYRSSQLNIHRRHPNDPMVTIHHQLPLLAVHMPQCWEPQPELH